jgi:hypothetical protein
VVVLSTSEDFAGAVHHLIGASLSNRDHHAVAGGFALV